MRIGAHLRRRWLAWANAALGLLWGLPWLAPVLMKLGAVGPARVIYIIYGFLCHQLADRSFFLFGPKWMVAYSELLPFAPDADTWMGLRRFVGTAELGYKIAWSDRMVWMYGGVLLGGLLFAGLRHRLKPLGWRGFLWMIAPMIVDGSTHWLSDFAGVGRGFRYNNGWLAMVTGNLLPGWFYVGNGWGSFNFWMRLITGLLFGLAIVWYLYPRIDRTLREQNETRTN